MAQRKKRLRDKHLSLFREVLLYPYRAHRAGVGGVHSRVATTAVLVSIITQKVTIRLGSDYKNNYYEYEIPLKLTEPRNNYNRNSSADNSIHLYPMVS